MKYGPNAGFGIIEILVSITLLSIVAVGIASVFESMARMQVHAQAKTESLALQQAVRTQLQAQEICGTSLTVPAITSTTRPLAIKVSLGGTTVEENRSPVGYTDIEVSHFKLENIRLEATLASTNRVYSGDVVLGAKSRSGTFFKPATAVRLFLTTSSTGTFVNCYSGEVAAQCRSLGGTYDPATTPACQMASASDVRMCVHKISETSEFRNCCNSRETGDCHRVYRQSTGTYMLDTVACLCKPRNAAG